MRKSKAQIDAEAAVKRLAVVVASVSGSSDGLEGDSGERLVARALAALDREAAEHLAAALGESIATLRQLQRRLLDPDRGGRPCEVCGAPLGAVRSDARTCSNRCRQALHRTRQAAQAAL